MKASILILLVFCVTESFAIRYEFGQNVTISQPINEDLYVGGGNVIINAPIRGDLIAAGGTVTVNDSVTNDILLAGGTVILNGYVGDDIRCAGGTIQVLKRVKGDLVIAGGTVTLERGSIVAGSLLATGGTTALRGQVDRNAEVTFGTLTFTGTVGGDIICRGDKATLNGQVGGTSRLAANTLSVGPLARFEGDVRYWNESGEVAFGQSINGHKTIFDNSLALESQRGRGPFATTASVLTTLWYLGMALLMIYLIQYIFSGTLYKAGITATVNTLPAVGAGFLFLIAVPAAAALAFATLIGVPVGLVLTFAYILVMLLAPVITALVAANALMYRAAQPAWSTTRMVFTAFGMFILLQVLLMVPFLGWLLLLISVSLAFGAVLLNIRWHRPGHSAEQPTLAATA